MNNTIHHIIGVSVIGLMLFPAVLFGQQREPLPVQPDVFQSIEQAYQAGRLSKDELILQKYYAIYRNDKLDSSFRAANSYPIKCLVPLGKEYQSLKAELSEATVSEVEQMSRSSDMQVTYVSPSDNFIFHYDTTGTHAVPSERTLPEAIDEGIPDYIYHAAFAADSSYRYQVEQLGFKYFVEKPLAVEFRNFGFYGEFNYSGSTTKIVINNDFKGFPSNTHPKGKQLGALYVTLAHEIKHAIQYATNRLQGNSGSLNWTEMDATLMEEIVFDDVNDYYNYLFDPVQAGKANNQSIFGNPKAAIPGAYYHVTWALYFAEKYGMEIWVDMWNEVYEEPDITFLDALEKVLVQRNQTLDANHLINHLWHLGSGEQFAKSDFGFEEKEFYPNPYTDSALNSVPDSLTYNNLNPLASNYIEAIPPHLSMGQPAFHLTSSTPGVGIGVIGKFLDGSTDQIFAIDPNSKTQQIQTPWNWSDLDKLYIAVVNTHRNRTADYTLSVDSVVPDEDILAQNYPNPFNPTTRIEFSLNNQKDVKIEVFNSTGQKIRTLLNKTLNGGFHYVDFDGSGLASGVYFYRISTDQTVTTNKMLLIK